MAQRPFETQSLLSNWLHVHLPADRDEWMYPVYGWRVVRRSGLPAASGFERHYRCKSVATQIPHGAGFTKLKLKRINKIDLATNN